MTAIRRMILLLVVALAGACGTEDRNTIADPDRFLSECEDYFDEGRESDRLRDAATESDRTVRAFCDEVYEAEGAQAPLEMDSEVSPGNDQDDTPKRDVPQGSPPAPAGVPQTSP